MSDIEVGDYVTIGDNSLTWQVGAIFPNECAYGDLAALRSGQTERLRYEAVAVLQLFRKGGAE